MTMISLFPPIFIGPVSGGANAANNPLRIRIEPKVARSEFWAAVLAQERYEWGFKWKCLVLPALFLEKHIELMGHAIETYVAVTAYGANYDAYEANEAVSLGWYSAFEGMTLDDKIAALKAKREPARRWALRHMNFIRWALKQEPKP